MKIEKQLLNGIKLLREGKEEGFNILYSKTYNFVYGRARIIMKNDENALELTQDAYVQVYNGIGNLKKDKNIYSWLSAIVYNRGMKMFSMNKEILLDEGAEYLFEDVASADVETNPQESLDEKATSEIIKNMINSLPEVQRMAIMAFYYDDMKIDDIARAMECSPNTIKSRLNYAKKSLKEMVEMHEKKNRYKLHSLTPGAISLAVGALIAQKECVMVEAAVGSVYASACSTVGVTATAISATSNAVMGATAGVFATIGAKIGIGAAIIATTGGIAAGSVALTRNFSTDETQSETTTVHESQRETESQSDEESITGPNIITEYIPVKYADKRTVILLGTNGISVYNNHIRSEISKNTGYTFSEVVTFADTDVIAVLNNENGTIGFLLTDGTIWNGGSEATWYNIVDDKWIVLERTTGENVAYDVYNSELELCYSGLDEFIRPTKVDTFGNYFLAYDDEYTYVYNSDLERVNLVKNNNGFDVILNGNYLWDGMTLRDGSYKEVTIDNPKILFPNATEVSIVKMEKESLSNELASVEVLVSNADGTEYYKDIYLASNLKLYSDYLDTPLTAFTWIECGEVNIIRDSDDSRYLAWAESQEVICRDYEWEEVIDTGLYFMGAAIYGENRIIVEIAWMEDGNYVTGLGVLYRKYNYSIDKAEVICINKEGNQSLPEYENRLWYIENRVLHDREYYTHENVFMNTDSAYYGDWIGDEYVVYTAWGEEYMRTDVEICASITDTIFVSCKEENGQKIYDIYELSSKPNVSKPELDQIIPDEEETEPEPDIEIVPAEIEWYMDGNTLYITGGVDMDDYEYNSEVLFAPWIEAYKDTIEHVIIGEGVTSIGEAAFQGCANLKSAVIPNSVTAIKKAAFHNCTSLEEVDLPDNLEELGWGAFYNTGLTSVVVPGTIISVSESWFANCICLKEITLEEGNPSVVQTMLTGCSALETVNLPDGITIISWASLKDCTSLEKFIVPDGTTRIMSLVFDGCTSLVELYIPDSVVKLDDDFLGSIADTVTIYCKEGSTAETYAIEHGVNYLYY